MRQLILSLFVIAGLLLTGCAASRPEAAQPAAAPTMAPAATEAPAMGAGERTAVTDQAANAADIAKALQADRMIIYNGSMVLIVKDTEATAQEISTLIKGLGGYMASMSAFRYADTELPGINMTVRVPAESFDAARTALRKMAVRVENENVNTNDVTDQFIDLQARLKTLKATETELQALLTETRQRGGKVEDIMSIYRELTNIRAQIESIQGQLNALSKQVAFSTLDLTLTPDALSVPITTDEWRPLETLRSSLSTLVTVLQRLIDFLIRLIIVIVPVLVILAIPVVVVILLIRWLVRRRKHEPTASS